MKYKRFYDKDICTTGVSGIFSAYGSFGIVDGSDEDMKNLRETETGFEAEYDAFSVQCRYEEYENKVYERTDYFCAKEDVVLEHYASRFMLEGGEYEVYTQYTSWQNESRGTWQPLNTTIEAAPLGIRSTEGAVPMMVIRNKGNGRMMVFHLMPNAQWYMRAVRMPIILSADVILIEMGIRDRAMKLRCHGGERIEMPKILFYETKNPLDFDAWRLHAVQNRLYPRKKLPVIYNTWLLDYGKVDVKEVYRQIDCAADLGIEYFAIDAGWFGLTEDATAEVGHWVEKRGCGYDGHLAEVSAYVRQKGMGFGLWFEPERAKAIVDAVKQHPDYYMKGSRGTAFLDFSKKEAAEYILDILSKQIEKYHVTYIKFDFNESVAYDVAGEGFYRYQMGHARFIRALRERFPNLYLTNCAAGGLRIDLQKNMLYDSVWLSDNHSQREWLRAFKDTALRMPPSSIEKWDSRRFFDGFPNPRVENPKTLPFSCDGAMWNSCYSLSTEYTHAYLSGGPLGFSGDIASYPEEEKKQLRELIQAHKDDQGFYQNAVLRILHDTDDVVVIQYSDLQFKRNVIQLFCKKSRQATLTVYPVLSPDATYRWEEEEVRGAELMEDGLVLKMREASVTELCRV